MGKNGLEMVVWVTLEVDAVSASGGVESEASLLSVLRNAVGRWYRQPACAARADAGHKNVPEVARNPSWVDPGKVKVEKGCYVAAVAWRLSFHAKMRDQRSDRLIDTSTEKLSQG